MGNNHTYKKVKKSWREGAEREVVPSWDNCVQVHKIRGIAGRGMKSGQRGPVPKIEASGSQWK